MSYWTILKLEKCIKYRIQYKAKADALMLYLVIYSRENLGLSLTAWHVQDSFSLPLLDIVVTLSSAFCLQLSPCYPTKAGGGPAARCIVSNTLAQNCFVMATCQPQISCNKKPVMSVVYGGYEGSRCPANAIMPKQTECATHQDQMMVWKRCYTLTQ